MSRSDPRLRVIEGALSDHDICPVARHGGSGCDGPEEIFRVLIVSPSGAQRVCFACVEHLPLEVEATLYGMRTPPPAA